MEPHETPAIPRNPDGDAGRRILGMVIGGGAGALLLTLLSTHGRTDPLLILALPGVGLAAVSGAFSMRRSAAWGGITALAGVVWTLLVVWMRSPTRTDPLSRALEVAGTLPGAIHLAIVVAAGLAAGAGWKKSPRAIDPDADAEAWD
jgi:hypothetical protein